MLEHVISVSGALGGGGTIGSTEDAEPTTAPEMISGARHEDEMHGDDNGLREQNAAARKRKVADEGNFDANKEEEEEDDDDLGIAFTVLDLSRVIFEKLLDGSHTQESHQESKGKGKFKPELHLVTGETWSKREIESELAEVRNDLGDIGLETGAFMSQN